MIYDDEFFMKNPREKLWRISFLDKKESIFVVGRTADDAKRRLKRVLKYSPFCCSENVVAREIKKKK